jgi:hypothetical protein
MLSIVRSEYLIPIQVAGDDNPPLPLQLSIGHADFFAGQHFMRGVNHCTLHCRLAKIRGLMYGGKHSAVIGRETRFFCMRPVKSSRLLVLSSQSQRRISP